MLDLLSRFRSSKSLLLSLNNSNWVLELLLELIRIGCKREGGIILNCNWFCGGEVKYIIDKRHL